MANWSAQDEQGNRYYRTNGGKIDPTLDFERRWVIYNGYAEASRIPPSWHGWMHHTVDVPPTEENYTAARMGKAARPEHDGHAGGLSPVRLDARQRPPPQGDRRLPALDAGQLNQPHPAVCACARLSLIISLSGKTGSHFSGSRCARAAHARL